MRSKSSKQRETLKESRNDGQQKGEVGFRYRYNQTKAQARILGRKFTLSYCTFKTIVTKPCFYCGQKPKLWVYKAAAKMSEKTRRRNSIKMNGVDRVDNSKGYIAGNCITACSTCNYMRGSLTQKEFKKAVRSVYKHWAKK